MTCARKLVHITTPIGCEEPDPVQPSILGGLRSLIINGLPSKKKKKRTHTLGFYGFGWFVVYFDIITIYICDFVAYMIDNWFVFLRGCVLAWDQHNLIILLCKAWDQHKFHPAPTNISNANKSSCSTFLNFHKMVTTSTC